MHSHRVHGIQSNTRRRVDSRDVDRSIPVPVARRAEGPARTDEIEERPRPSRASGLPRARPADLHRGRRAQIDGGASSNAANTDRGTADVEGEHVVGTTDGRRAANRHFDRAAALLKCFSASLRRLHLVQQVHLNIHVVPGGLDRRARVVVAHDLGGILALEGHAIGPPLRHADPVSIAAAVEGELARRCAGIDRGGCCRRDDSGSYPRENCVTIARPAQGEGVGAGCHRSTRIIEFVPCDREGASCFLLAAERAHLRTALRGDRNSPCERRRRCRRQGEGRTRAPCGRSRHRRVERRDPHFRRDHRPDHRDLRLEVAAGARRLADISVTADDEGIRLLAGLVFRGAGTGIRYEDGSAIRVSVAH